MYVIDSAVDLKLLFCYTNKTMNSAHLSGTLKVGF